MRSPSSLVRAVSTRAVVATLALIAIMGWAIVSRSALAHTVGQIRALPGPSWPSISVAAAAVVASYWFAALALRAAAGRRLPLGRTVAVQLAAAVANRLTPGGIGGAAVNARFLSTQGLSAGSAGAAISLSGAAHVAIATIGILLIGPTLGLPGWARSLGSARLGSLPLAVVALPLAGTLCWLTVRMVRARCRGDGPIASGTRDARAALVVAVHEPRRLSVLLAATAAVKATNLLALLAATWAFDGDIADWRVAVVYLVGVPAAEAIPTPGGLGTVDAALLAGLAHVGAGTGGAVVAAVVLFRLLTYWGPIVPGAIASGILRRQNAL
jgi:uncharacterized membrane protein YbhN (UPF0104 family)